MMWQLALKSLVNRRATALLTLFTIAISVTLLLGVERIRTEAKASFANTISGTDLIVGARSGQVNLLLYSVFRIGNATNNIDWNSYQHLTGHPSVKWAIPISLGDSHRGFRVVGTNGSYFAHYKYGYKQPLAFQEGKAFSQTLDAVIGSSVAKELGYNVGDEIVIAHGIADRKFARHDNLPFTVTGILSPTGTPVDRSVHVPLAGIEAIHIGWESGARLGKGPDPSQIDNYKLEPEQITAVLLGLNSRLKAFAVQREVNEYRQEPLTAIMPGVALHELWQMMSVAEQALLVVSVFVVVAGLLGMLSTLLSTLNERRREMAILRAVGAKPVHIFTLLMSEATLLTLAGEVLGIALLYGILAIASPILSANYGLLLPIRGLSEYEWMLAGLILAGGVIIGVVPALLACKRSLSDGMTMRV
ncbi:ABC transporter permease [Parasalinivibrio latis]|uniref:ABC transporter permease n=1 Tax=Parasalinivibrio latis TaxID=2952610 RepID=UPI0030E19719